jgi:hypothetical protein
MSSLGCPIRNASLKVAGFQVSIPDRFSLPADTILALIAACTLPPATYFSINMKGLPAQGRRI